MTDQESRDEFARIIRRHRQRMAECSALHGKLGYLYAEDGHGYALLLTRNTVQGDGVWRVTSFRDGVPVGHRGYDHLQGSGPVNNAFQEFASHGLTFMERRGRVLALA